ncbi:MAG: adenylate/guanylate cyclase domain-containing protein, partial [Desulfosporosinus sp.]
VRAKWSILVMMVFLVVYTLTEAVVFQTLKILLPYLYPILIIIAVYIFSVVTQYLKERKERGRITGIFGRYVSKAVVQEILSSKEEIKVGGVRKDITLLFVDIRGFTPLSEKMEPEDIINILNDYLDLCSRAVFTQEGTIDKFMGDGVMAIFGAPIEQKDHLERAIRAALQMQRESGKFAEDLLKRYGRSVSFGIGINSGPAVVGNIGSQARMDYTAIGDTVNLAARLESNAKPGQILISKDTYERIKETFKVIPLDPIKVKGKEKLVEIYQVEGEFDEHTN